MQKIIQNQYKVMALDLSLELPKYDQHEWPFVEIEEKEDPFAPGDTIKTP